MVTGFYTAKYVARKVNRLRSARRRRLQFKDRGGGAPRRRPAAGPDKDYGLAALASESEDDPEPEDPEEERGKKAEILKLLQDSLQKLREIEAYPQGSPQWIFERRLRLTASFFGRVCKMLPGTSCRVLLQEMLYKGGRQTSAMKHGSDTESIAKENLRLAHNILVRNSGLHVDEQIPFLAASPGMVTFHEY